MALAHLVKSSVKRARTELGDLAISFTVEKKIGSTYYNGKNIPQYRTYTLHGAYDKFEAYEIDGSLVRTTDCKVMLFIDSNDDVPTSEDRIVDGSETYQVVRSQSIYAGNDVVLSMTQMRK